MADETVDTLVEEMVRRVERIDNYPKNWQPYMDLYETAMKAIPFLSGVKEIKGVMSQFTEGMLRDDFIITCKSRVLGKEVIVEDIRYRGEEQVQRNYTVMTNFMKKVVASEIKNINLATNTYRIVQKNKFNDI